MRPPKSLRPKSGKKPGGQPGHGGHHLQQVELPNEVLIHAVQRCEACQHDVRDLAAEYTEHRQVMDLPALRLWVSEHRVEEKCCPVCSHRTRAAFPPGVNAPAHYGTGIQALAVYLVEGQVVPYARTSQLLHDLLGIQLSAGSIATFVGSCHQQLAQVELQLKAALLKAAVIHPDETGLRVGKTGQWVHVCSTERLPHSAVHPTRGREALTAFGMMAHFSGTSVHDGLASYQGYPCRHALYRQEGGHLTVPADHITPVTLTAAVVSFFVIAYLTRQSGFWVAVGSAIVGTIAAPMIFELPFDLIVLWRTSPPVPGTLLILIFFLPLILVEILSLVMLTFSPVMKLSRSSLFLLAGMFVIFAVWAMFGFA